MLIVNDVGQRQVSTIVICVCVFFVSNNWRANRNLLTIVHNETDTNFRCPVIRIAFVILR